MHVVSHEYVRVYSAVLSDAYLSQFMPVAQIVFSTEKARLTIIAPLHDMLGNVRQIDTWLTGHNRSLWGTDSLNGPALTEYQSVASSPA
jgi:hypothetical protein